MFFHLKPFSAIIQLMKKRVFIAINLPEHVKDKLQEYQRKWADLPVRWTRRNSLHLTLVFIGYVTDEEMAEICDITRQVAQKHAPFNLEFDKIILGPPDKPSRMIWVEGKESEEMAALKKDLEMALINASASGFDRVENRAFRPHITLARMRLIEWRKLPEKPQIAEQTSITVPVESIEVMESHLRRSGAEYDVLESVPLEK